MDIGKQSKRVQHKLGQYLDIPKDIVFDLPKITLIGNLQVYIENHRGVIEYSGECIRLAVTGGELEITGAKLVIRNITREEVYLDGVIRSINFKR